MNNISPSDVERKKNTLDLRPALEFVHRHSEKYEEGFNRLLGQEHSSADNLWGIDYVNTDQIDGQPQTLPTDVEKILPRLPESFQQLSRLILRGQLFV